MVAKFEKFLIPLISYQILEKVTMFQRVSSQALIVVGLKTEEIFRSIGGVLDSIKSDWKRIRDK